MSKNERGQAMIEYGILLFVFVLLLVGGAELGMAALASSKNTDAAKAGASEYADILAKRIEVKTLIDRQLIDLSMLNCNYVDENGACSLNHPDARNYFVFLSAGYSSDPENFIADENERIQLIIDSPASPQELQQAQRQFELLQNFELFIQYNPPIADHDLIASMPNCDNDAYDYGMPNRYRPRLVKNGVYDIPPPLNSEFYFFTPTPLDVTNCTGTDPLRGNRSKQDILIYGYMPTDAEILAGDFDDLYVQGLPKANQAAYSNYERVCIDSNQLYVSCNSADVDRVLLKQSGKVCFADDEDEIDSCPGIQPLISGFYYFGNPNDATEKHTYQQDELPEFRPAFQLVCDQAVGGLSDQVTDLTCLDAPESIRVQTRYRRVFDGFLTMGLQTAVDPDIVKYFYNPALVGVREGALVGTLGSEIGPIGNRAPSIKYMKDFRACYGVNALTGSVTACN